MDNVISEETLRSTATGLPGLFARILSFIDSDMKHVSEVAAIHNMYDLTAYIDSLVLFFLS